MKDCMIDLETWGTRPGCAVRSIGAVQFSPEGEIGATFYSNIADRSSWVAGLSADRQTMNWWGDQTPEARAALAKEQRDIGAVVMAMNNWFAHHGLVRIWCHGATFDEPIWNAAAHACGVRVPWQYRDVRCTRTLFDLASFDMSNHA